MDLSHPVFNCIRRNWIGCNALVTCRDSLLFAAGTFCAGVVQNGQTAELNFLIVIPLLICAALLGDNLNYYIGKNIGLKVMQWKIKGRQIVKQAYIDKTQSFYDKHGPKTIIVTRYVPIVRTFAPFVAGVGEMKYYNFFKIQYRCYYLGIWFNTFRLLFETYLLFRKTLKSSYLES